MGPAIWVFQLNCTSFPCRIFNPPSNQLMQKVFRNYLVVNLQNAQSSWKSRHCTPPDRLFSNLKASEIVFELHKISQSTNFKSLKFCQSGGQYHFQASQSINFVLPNEPFPNLKPQNPWIQEFYVPDEPSHYFGTSKSVAQHF